MNVGSTPTCEALVLRHHLSIEIFRRAAEFGLSVSSAYRRDVRVKFPQCNQPQSKYPNSLFVRLSLLLVVRQRLRRVAGLGYR